MNSIGILAGGGQFPRLIIEEARKNNCKVILAGFQGHTDEALLALADSAQMFHIGQFAKVIKFFHSHDIHEVSLAGSINKPKILDVRPDWLATKIIFSLKSKGDDALLRAIIDQLEKEKLFVVSASKLLPSLLAPSGILTKTKAHADVQKTLDYALPIMQTLGPFDIGQCIAVKENMVLAVECIEGTDATIKRGGELGKRGDSPLVLVKLVKDGQDERVDLPSIGLQTIENLVEYNYKALIIEENKTLFFDREKALELANKHGLIIWAIDKEKVLNSK